MHSPELPTGGRFSADFKQSKQAPDLAANLRAVRAKTGKSFGAQVMEIYKLGRGFGKLTSQDYFFFGLYDDNRFDWAKKSAFLSDRIHASIISRVCDHTWWAGADDKFLAGLILGGAGAPVPMTQAAYTTGTRRYGVLPVVHSTQALHEFLAHRARYPLFAKPVAGIASFGVFLIEGYDAKAATLQLAGGGILALGDFSTQIGIKHGYLLQDELKPHADLLRVCGPRVSTARIVIIIEDGQPEIIQTVWKVPAAGNIADNFWRTGNVIAAIDAESGAVWRIVQGVGPDQVELDVHPDTGQTLKGLVLPHWPRVKSLCLEMAMVFSELRYQSWDIAICAEGPVVVEVNTGASFMLSQVATGEGFLTDRFRRFLVSAGFSKLAR